MLQEFLKPILLSLEVTVISGILVIVTGTILGKMLSVKSFKGKTIVETIIMLPLVLPPSVVGFLLIVIFGIQSPLGQAIEWIFKQPIMFTKWAAILASTVVAFPLMYQSAKTGFQGIDRDIEDAARLDGANEWKLFLRISVPLALPSLITGSILSCARALGEFGATLMFAGNIPGKTQTIPTAIYVAIDSGNMQMAWLWVLSIIIISFIMLWVAQIKKND
jgi:molybdate transport system permease protein